MTDSMDVIVLMGPPGSGKSFLCNELNARGIASYRELEPLIRKRFGDEDEMKERLREVGAFVWMSNAGQYGRCNTL